MERKIGEIFEYNGEWHQCVESDGTCNGCVGKFQSYSFCNDFEECVGKIFKKLEKVGEPYEFDGHLFQSYRTFEVPIFTENYSTVRELGNNSKISIEIKQNKEEDMEEKKQKLDKLVDDYMACRIQYAEFDKEIKALYDKEESEPTLKQFDLEAAKLGKPVCTRDGRKARIICFDRESMYPIVALVETKDREDVYNYLNCGKDDEDVEKEYDLMMLPEKKERWVNVYKGGLLDTKSYNTKKEAFDKACPEGYVDTVKVQWEE